jgi:hypothetical protein
MTNRMTFEQVGALYDEMRALDAQDAEFAFDGGSSNVMHVSLSRDDEDTFCGRATISVAGTVRPEWRVAA